MITSGEIAILSSRADVREADHHYRDDAGGDWYRFVVDWTCDDRTYSTHIWARDLADAERRLLALRTTARIEGQVKAERDCA